MEEEHLKILPDCIEKFGDIKVTLVEVKGDISHVKARIDNGMSKTLADVHDLLLKLEPKIKHHADVINRIENIGWALAYAIGGAVLFTVVWAIAHGAKIV